MGHPPATSTTKVKGDTDNKKSELHAGEDDSLLGLVLALFVLVGNLADFVGLKEDYLGQALVGVNLCGERSGVADLEGDETFPFGLERRDVDDDSAAGVGEMCIRDRRVGKLGARLAISMGVFLSLIHI